MYIRLSKSWSWRNYSWDDYLQACIKKQKKTPSVSAVVHFYSVSTVHIKDQKKPNEYDQEIPQSYIADQDQAWYYSAFY